MINLCLLHIYIDAYCFVCILAWTEQSRRCPLCVANIELLVHNIRSEKDYQKVQLSATRTDRPHAYLSTPVGQHYLPPLLKSDSPPPERSIRELREGARRQLFNRPTHPRFKYAEWKARNKPAAMPDVDAEDLALEKRRYVYKYNLYVKHVATNRFTRVSVGQVTLPIQPCSFSFSYSAVSRLFSSASQFHSGTQAKITKVAAT